MYFKQCVCLCNTQVHISDWVLRWQSHFTVHNRVFMFSCSRYRMQISNTTQHNTIPSHHRADFCMCRTKSPYRAIRMNGKFVRTNEKLVRTNENPYGCSEPNSREIQRVSASYRPFPRVRANIRELQKAFSFG